MALQIYLCFALHFNSPTMEKIDTKIPCMHYNCNFFFNNISTNFVEHIEVACPTAEQYALIFNLIYKFGVGKIY